MSNDFVQECSVAGVPIQVISGFRSFAKQDELYAQGRTKPGPIVTNAKAGYSFHNYGVAIDIALLKHTNWTKVSQIGKSIGFEWGGDFQTFVDMPHFEVKLGYKIQDFLNKKVDFTKYNN